MTTDRERGQIHAAMDRLLAGTPLRSDGALTVVSLAVEADVKRHVLTHRHTDLKDEFYARVRAQGRVPASEQELRDELKATQEKLAEVREENRQLKASVEAFARIVNVLTAENDRLTQQQSEPGNRTLDSTPTRHQLKRNQCEQTSFVSNEPLLRPPSCP
jgi:septal ring factor EnvC (AmiA/AmiB activator)